MLPHEQTSLLVFFNLFLILMIYLTLKKSLRKPFIVLKSNYKLAKILCLIFCLFSFWGMDWFHYQESFERIKLGGFSHLEDIYVWIINNLSPNYLIFRVIIWGSALLLFFRILKYVNVSKDLALLFFGVIYIIWFSYARVSLAMAIIYYAFALLSLKEKRNKMTYILSIGLIILSFYFHKSSLFLIAVTGFVYIIRKFPKKALLLLLISFPLIVVFVQTQIASFMISDIDTTEGDLSSYMASGQNYMNRESDVRGIAAIIRTFLEISPYYIVSFILYKLMRSKLISEIPNDIKSFMLLQIVIVVFSSVFAFDLGANTNVLYGRFLRFAAIPTVIVLAYLYQHKFYRKLTNCALLLAVLGSTYSLLYAFYTTLV